RLKRHSAILSRESKMGLIKKGAASTKPLAWKVELRAKIEELRRLEKAAFGSRHGKTDFHGALRAVFNGWDWANPKVSRRVGRRVAKLYRIDTRKNKIPIRVVINPLGKRNPQQKRRGRKVWGVVVGGG